MWKTPHLENGERMEALMISTNGESERFMEGWEVSQTGLQNQNYNGCWAKPLGFIFSVWGAAPVPHPVYCVGWIAPICRSLITLQPHCLASYFASEQRFRLPKLGIFWNVAQPISPVWNAETIFFWSSMSARRDFSCSFCFTCRTISYQYSIFYAAHKQPS